jgi:FkbM family methyltransferase
MIEKLTAEIAHKHGEIAHQFERNREAIDQLAARLAELTTEIAQKHGETDQDFKRNREATNQLTARLAEANQSILHYRKEAKCRQLIGSAIARYFIIGDRTSGGATSIRFEDVTIDSNPDWIPEILARTNPSEPEFIVFKHFNEDNGTILDIGANYGYAAASIWAAGATSTILSFEPNPWHMPCLARIKHLRPGKFDYLNVGLGAMTDETRYVIPVIEGVGISALSSAAMEAETAWTIPENVLHHMIQDNPDVEEPRLQFAEVIWHTQRLDDVLPTMVCDVGLSQISAMKIDVEGYEAKVLSGAPDTLLTHKPLIMIEGANRNPEVMSCLLSGGYRYADLEADHVVLSNEVSSRSNGFFLHESKLAHYRSIGLLVP